jgi:flagellar hook-associated protein 1 FlgK
VTIQNPDDATDTYTGEISLRGSVGQNFYGNQSTIYTWDDTAKAVTAKTYANGITADLTVTYTKGDDGIVSYTTTATAVGEGTETTATLEGINIINALNVNTILTAENGQNLVAARGWGSTTGKGTDTSTSALHIPEVNGTGDGTNAVNMSTLFNMNQKDTSVENDATVTKRSIGTISFEAYYNERMTALGSDAETMDSKVTAQDEVLIQVNEWRQSVSAVNWNEELTNMIMFQQGYSACSRCLTTMDEMLDKLINSTGTVGR